jgi:transposase
MTPLLRRTWGQRGVTPTIAVRARSHEKVSGIGALVVSPHRRRVTLALTLRAKDNIRGPQVHAFLRHLQRQVRRPVMLLWDQGPSHKHRDVRAWIAAHPRWHIVWLPAYAPELNPVEQLWTYLKYGRLANFAPDDVGDIQRAVRREQRRLARRPSLLKSFFRHSALPFRI